MKATDLPPLIRDCVDGPVSPITAAEVQTRTAMKQQGAVRTLRGGRRPRRDVVPTGLEPAGRGGAVPRPGHRRAGWAVAVAVAGAAVVTAAVTVIAVRTATEPGGPPTATGHHPAGPSGSPTAAGHHQAGQSARQILLTAAAAAARTPARTGTYWYVKSFYMPGFPDTFETWELRNGVNWVRAYKTNGHIIKGGWEPGWDLEGDPGLGALRSKFHKPGDPNAKWPGELTFTQIQRLPASTAALKAWIFAFNRNYDISQGFRPIAPAPADAGVFVCLTNLIAEMPSPPQVRAAAFRVMATLPGISQVDGGRGLRLSLGGRNFLTLLVDPATAQARDVISTLDAQHKVLRLSVTAHWVNRLPKAARRTS